MRTALIAVLLAVTGAASAADHARRVALVGVPARVRAAVSTTLEPWAIEVVEVESGEEPPGPRMPENAEEARALGRRHQAEAVVWLTSDDESAALWLYDASGDRVVARELPGPPPFDEPTAAEVALSVKTLLRHSAAAPEEERFGARESAAPPARPAIAFESMAGVRLRPTSADDVEPRLGVALLWSPAPLGRHLAASLSLRAGPGINVSAPSFVGHLSDLSVTAAGRVGSELGPRLRAAGWLGTTLHVTHLDGAVLPADERADAVRFNPSIDAGVIGEFSLGAGVRLQLRGEGGLALRRQRYLVRGQEVLELPAYELELGLGVAIPIH